MQIPSIPPPIVSNALSQDVVARAVPNVQATAPLIQNAVAPAPKSEKSTQSRSNQDKGGNGEERAENAEGKDQRKDNESTDDNSGHSINIQV